MKIVAPRRALTGFRTMLDALFLVGGILFLVVTAAYADACDRL